MANEPYEFDLAGSKRARSVTPDYNFAGAARAIKHARGDDVEHIDTEEVSRTVEIDDFSSTSLGRLRAPKIISEQPYAQNENDTTSAGFFRRPLGQLCGMMGTRGSQKALWDKRQEESKAEIVDLEDQIEGLKLDLSRARQSAEQCRKNYQDEKSARASDLRQHNEVLQKEHATYEQQADKIKRDLEKARSQKHAADKVRRTQEHKIEDLEQTVRSLQSRALQSVESEKWAPLSNSDIKHELRAIMSATRQWTQTYCSLEFEQVVGCFEILASTLVKYGCTGRPEELLNALLGSEALRKSGKAFSLLGCAILNSFIFRKIIGDPFFAFQSDQQQSKLLYSGYGEAMSALVKSIASKDPSGAETWRCQLLRLLDPDVVRNSCSSAAASLSHEFLYTELKVKRVDDESQNELSDLIKQATELSWRLWTRKTRIEVHDWTSEPLLGNTTVYMADSDRFEAHSLHSGELDDDPKAKDQTEIVLLCNPVVTISNNTDDNDYSQRTILQKAVIWMG